MGFIDDFTRLMRTGPELVSSLDSVKLNTKSVVRGANDATFQFPCLMVDTIPIDMANTIVRALDRRYAAFTQTWISLHPFMDISLDPTPISYLKRLHQNMKLESTEDDWEEELETSMVENTYNGEPSLYVSRNGKYGMLIEGSYELGKSLLNDNKAQLAGYLSDYNLQPLPGVTVEADEEVLDNPADLVRMAINGNAERNAYNNLVNQMKMTDRAAAPTLIDREVKRTNDMVPFGIQVKLIAKNEKNQFVQNFHIVIGVKAVLHPIKSDDMIDNLQKALKNRSTFFKFLRWTTGELALVKNLILDLDNLRDDAINRDRNLPYFGALRRLRGKKIGMRNLTVPHAMIPNSTIVISSYEADYMMKNYGIDLKLPHIAKKVMNSLFLMSFIIVDDGSGTVSIFDDGSDAYQVYALETLERENMLASNKLGREIGRMVAQ